MTLRDSAQVIGKLNPRSSKAFYRSGRALLLLERFDDALDCCDKCLAFDSGNTLMKSLRGAVLERIKARDEKLAEKERKAKAVREEAELLKVSCLVSQLAIVPSKFSRRMTIQHPFVGSAFVLCLNWHRQDWRASV